MVFSAFLRRWTLRSGEVGVLRSLRYYRFGRETSAVRLKKSPPPSIPLPWVVERGEVVHKRSLDTGDGELVGSSHGWVALFNKRSNDLFLTDPLSHRRVTLPPVTELPDPDLNLDLDGHGTVWKVVLSSSPDDDECRAMMIFGPAKRVAICSPGRSSGWTAVGELFKDEIQRYTLVSFARVHEDLVYLSRKGYFSSVSPCHFNWEASFLRDRRIVWPRKTYFCTRAERYIWNIQKPRYPRMNSIDLRQYKYKNLDDGGPRMCVPAREVEGGRSQTWLEEKSDILKKQCIQIPHLVYAEHSGQLFLVQRYLMLIDSGGSPLEHIPYCPVKGLEDVFECRTFGFIVMEMSTNLSGGLRGLCTLVEDLKGMAMFVGINHSFAIPATEVSGLKPNSIYFSDAKRSKMMCGVNDYGIFDYQNKIIL